MQNLQSIRSILITLLLIIFLGSGIVSYKATTLFSDFNNMWETYSEDVQEKQRILHVIRGQIGYGGFIHHFKNYVLRQDPLYINLIVSSRDALLESIDDYQSFSLNTDELVALKQLRTVVEQYDKNLPIVIQAQKEGWSPTKTDQLVLVNDEPAINALKVLELNWLKRYQYDVQKFNSNLEAGQIVTKFGLFVVIMLSIVILLSIWFIHRITAETTTRKKLESRLYMSDAVIKHITNGVSVADLEGNLLFVNPAFENITGYSSDEVVGKNPSIMSSGQHDKAFYKAMWDEILQQGYWEGEIWNKRKNGEIYPEWIAIFQLPEASTIGRYIAIFSDITERKQKEEHIEHLAKYDSLTQLPNRYLFFDRIQSAILGCHRSDLKIALLFLDLDGFKPVNDLYGHSVGDKVLIEVGKRIKSVIRETDSVCRYGGDEFLVLLSDIYNEGGWSRIAETLLNAINTPYFVDGDKIMIGVSIGVATYSPDDNKVESEKLVLMSDKAMYRAKSLGKNQYCVYSPKDD